MNKFPLLSRLGAFRVRGIRTVCLLLTLAFFSPGLFAQDTQPAGEDSQTESAEAQTKPASSGEDDTTQTVERGSVPDVLRRPEKGEAPRYPQDIVIGELGQGKAPDGAYQFALDLLRSLTAGSKDAQIVTDSRSVLTDTLLEEINSIEPRTYRLGGGRIEDDGDVSFLVRFLGSDYSITGELFLRQTGSPAAAESSDSSGNSQTADPDSGAAPDSQAAVNPPAEGKWFLDDLVLEDKIDLTNITDSYHYDFSPYERLY